MLYAPAMKRLISRLAVLVNVAALAACGSSSSMPTPQPLQLAGIWTMTETRTSVTGGECLDGTFQPTVGTSNPMTMTFTQNGTSLNATGTGQSSGVTCSWSGTADVDRFALTLLSCQQNANQFGLHCANGAVRDLRIASSGISVVVTAAGYAGTKSDTYNVDVGGTFTQVGALVVSSNVTMTK